ACEQTIAITVQNPTILSIQSPPIITSGQVLKLEGFLKTSSDKLPLADQNIELVIDSVNTGIMAKTDSAGYYMIEHRMKNAGIISIDVKYGGQEFYWDATANAVIEVVPSNNKTVIGLLLMLSGISLACGYIGYRFYRKNRKPVKAKPVSRRKAKKVMETPVTTEVLPSPAAQSQDILSREFDLVISFPGIIPPLPDTWSIDDAFEVACWLKDANQQPVADRQIEIGIGSPITILTTDINGRCSVTLAFSEKGEFEIEAAVVNDGQNGQLIHSTKVVRIVDYRDSIIQDYKALLERFKSKNVSILSHNTPHQIEKKILDSDLDIPADALATVIACFEEAVYSSHPITRQEFVRMQLAQQEILEYENQSQNISALIPK
ncbi:MAG TPA: hypothetical protein VLH15_03375, partial [Dehalococcoidales bacterium]|nr:hypothetical protein [Dehalococcoidales bacterium]